MSTASVAQRTLKDHEEEGKVGEAGVGRIYDGTEFFCQTS